ncbi:MAG TPA: MFS transporter [Polyangiaceae bacterium]|jgi:MFS family permease|nr:MFS transporter [Polyangiaceae bacterium]
MPSRARLPTAIVALGLTSLFTDVGTELIFPLLPVFLASLGASTTFIGLIEGLADATASFLKLGSGILADRVARKKPLVWTGYALATFTRPLVALAASPLHVLLIRVTDRIGKGIRTSPRDALIAAAARPGEAGRAFGFHSAMDHAGAVLGPLLATALLALGLSLRHVFALALIPGLLALLCLSLAPEPAPAPIPTPAPTAVPTPASPPLPPRLLHYLSILFLFSLGNSSDAFLLLRARDLGVQVSLIPLLWTTLNVSKFTSAYLGGAWSDRVPRVRLIVIGWFVYAMTYLAFGLANSAWQAWAIFLVYGAYHGLTEPAEKALVKDLAPERARGRAYGAYNFVIGVAAVPAGLLMGFLWQRFSPFTALAAGSALSFAASLALLLWQRGGTSGELGASS